MTRLLATIRWDATLQLRNGFYAATGFMMAFWVAVLLQAGALDWTELLAPMLVGNLLIGTFYFMAALVLLERDEDTLRALVVTPLHTGEYLWSKAITLSGLAVAETLVIALALPGVQLRLLPLLVGVLLAAMIYCLAGFIAVVRFPSINSFLLPSGLVTTVLWLPLIAFFAGWRPWLLALHPLTAPLLLVEASVADVPWWQQLYAVLYGTLWIAILLSWSRRAFRRWLVER